MTDAEANERANRFKTNNVVKSKEKIIDSPLVKDKHQSISMRKNEEEGDEVAVVSMADFEKMMDTLAMQPKAKVSYHDNLDDSFDEVDENMYLNVLKDEKFGVVNNNYNKNNNLATAFHSDQGNRDSQEDRCLVSTYASKLKALEIYQKEKSFLLDALSHFTIACIFDGHNGSKCAQYVCQNLPPRLLSHEKILEKPSDLEIAFRETFQSIDEEACSVLKNNSNNSGSTALVAIYDGRKHILTVASVGDSICIISRAGHAIRINKTHRLDNKEEKCRVIAQGGTIVNNRVNGVLAVSRAFGDISFKYDRGDSAYGTGPVIAQPDVAYEIVTPMTEFAIIASDGLFDVLDPQQAVNFVKKSLLKKEELQHISKELVELAIKEGSVDNITVIILLFHFSLK